MMANERHSDSRVVVVLPDLLSARKEGEPGIQNHVYDVGPYTKGTVRKGVVKMTRGRVRFPNAVVQHGCKRRPYELSARAFSSLKIQRRQAGL